MYMYLQKKHVNIENVLETDDMALKKCFFLILFCQLYLYYSCLSLQICFLKFYLNKSYV